MVRIGIRIFNHLEKSHIENVASQLQRRAGKRFLISQISEADAVLVSPGEPGFEMLVHGNKKKGAIIKIPIIYDTVNDGKYPFFLKKPATTPGLIELIELLEKAKITSSASICAEHLGSEAFDSDKSSTVELSKFVRLIKASKDKGQSISINVKETKPLFINHQTYKACVQYEDIRHKKISNNLLRMVTASDDELVEKVVSTKYIDQQMENANYGYVDLNLLLWLAALNSYQSFYVKQDAELKLKSWPDFTVLPYESDYLKLTACMIKYSGSIDDIVLRSGSNEDTVRKFVCACAALDLLEVNVLNPISYKKELNPPIEKMTKTIINKIVGRFFRKEAM